MNLSRKWPRLTLWPWIATKFFRLNEIKNFIEETDERYLDPPTWARIRGISIADASSQLEQGIRLGHFQKCLLYEWPDSPVRFLVPQSYLGKKIRLADVGYIGEDDQSEVLISPNRVREVFIAAENGVR